MPLHERTPIGSKLMSIGGQMGAVKCSSRLKMHYKVLIRKVQALNCSIGLHAMSGLSSRARNRVERGSPRWRRLDMCELKEVADG